MNFFKKQLLHHSIVENFVDIPNNASLLSGLTVSTVHPCLSGPPLSGSSINRSCEFAAERRESTIKQGAPYKPPSFRFSAIVVMKVKLFNNSFC